MPKEITKHKSILDAISKVDIISELVEWDKEHDHFKYELDLEVVAYGRNYNGKKVGPYVRLFQFDPGEEIIRQGDWGSNTFYITVDGVCDAYVADDHGSPRKVGEIPAGVSFGEMAILAGVPRNATVKASQAKPATVLEVTRPALRLLRKLPKFGQNLDITYRKHGLGRTLVDVQQSTGDAFDADLLKQLGDAARFMVYGKNHVVHREGQPIDRIVFINNGWVRCASGVDFNPAMADLAAALSDDSGLDFLGAGNCLGLEGVREDKTWTYTATILSRTEVLEISISHLRSNPKLRDAVLRKFGEFSKADDRIEAAEEAVALQLGATEKEISTGIVDGTNLLVMDMDLCVRCGNCSLACHKVHGQSRLLRRGIHIERPKKLGSTSSQHVLSPSVCLHCQDPECLTGCPTGAIGRFSNGQIDIDPKTCIGCGDCATQCPYNAISMIPRKPVAAVPPTWQTRLRKWFSLAPPEPPPEVTETENLLAVKCNLCNNTGLNPKGAKTHAYSCQENCPTGALVRVNPREYFTEVKNRIGIVFQDQTHAIGRNIHKRDIPARLWHVGGVLSTILLTALTVWAIFRYGLDGRLGGTWLTVRWLTGLVGLVGIAVVMAYPGRKQIYRRRAGALRYWMLAHVYAGIVAGLLLLLHGGRSTGGLLTSLLMISFDLVILTGLFGIACYIIVPRVMTSIEGEPLLIEDLRKRRDELRETLANIGTESTPAIRDIILGKVRPRYLSLGYLLRQYVRREDLSSLHSLAREDFKTELDNYKKPAEELQRTFIFGTNDPSQYRPEGRLLLEAIESTVTLRRVDSLIYLHQLLKLWLAPHVVATSLMLVLMLVHIIQVVFFRVH
ncbi:MAG TPA: cyclic nucleotide-binding domain-containing protein [Pyrinomonadaceae bacterium]|nr:cyclic nucleotide-binding domain-containing protein [Pyrinomonadaceae bacterium]